MVEKELGYAQHLAMFSTMVNLRHGDSGNLCRLLNSKVSNDGGNHSNILVSYTSCKYELQFCLISS